MDYNILIADKNTNGSIRNAVNYDKVPTVWVVEQAQQYVYERLRIREMQTSATGTLATAAGTLTLPARFRAAKDFRFTGLYAGFCTIKDAATVRQSWGYDNNGARTTAKPQVYYVAGTTLVFDYVADQDYPYDFLYYQALAPLTSDNPTNVLTDRAVRALNLTCLGFAAEHMKQPPDRQYYLAQADQEIMLLNQNSDMEISSLDEAAYAA